MKRIFSTVFAIFFLLISAGITLNMHYCQGKLIEVAFKSDNHSGCCSEAKSCHEEKSKKCCDDETVLIQFDEVQIPVYLPTLPLFDFANSLPQPSVDQSISLWQDSFITEEDYPPPDPQPLWLLYQSLTFYG